MRFPPTEVYMKNKKLFGKLNIIDILILLLLIAALVFAAVRLFGGKSGGVASELPTSEPNLRFTVLCTQLPRELADRTASALQGEDVVVGESIVSPRRIFNSNALLDAEIISWEIVEREDDLVDLRLTIEAASTVGEGIFSIGKQEIRIGVTYPVKTTRIELAGQVLSMEILS